MTALIFLLMGVAMIVAVRGARGIADRPVRRELRAGGRLAATITSIDVLNLSL